VGDESQIGLFCFPPIHILFQLFCVPIRNVFVGVSEPQLLQIPGRPVLSQVGSPEAAERVEPLAFPQLQIPANLAEAIP
jgi:hypothetical protein